MLICVISSFGTKQSSGITYKDITKYLGMEIGRNLAKPFVRWTWFVLEAYSAQLQLGKPLSVLVTGVRNLLEVDGGGPVTIHKSIICILAVGQHHKLQSTATNRTRALHSLKYSFLFHLIVSNPTFTLKLLLPIYRTPSVSCSDPWSSFHSV